MSSSPCLLIPATSPKRNPMIRSHTWIPLAHTPLEIRTRLTTNKTSFVDRSIDRFHHRSFQNLPLRAGSSSPHHSSSPSEPLLREYFHAFNALFFFNALSPTFCTFVVMGRNCEQWRREFASGGPQRRGATLKRAQPGLRWRAQVEVGIVVFEPVDARIGAAEKLRRCLGAMSAEMVRAFLGIYACACERCGARDGAAAEEAWGVVAVWMEGFARERLGLELDVVGDCGLVVEREWFCAF
ncbi:uncharacterized protein L3040_007575 [Drepanopeziza brunnea f. sp. 'multigermtubi']|uniref:Uncharacterized protein n=1 Tax=Marssonina brunnea f. sp. multigermtubi (strain MB_m1) TaxID=1072389 RepID=K1XZV9_MARBU|nr:uncharacterized protein MBM_03392 [Drepanopeziza brunnea f. sp. 'multigermtubi' MB_m1]EKD18399.1 hypothetical protein MBM_03392 [Drepanopeziza brunnea f. sp. 'multigermtubi' MB_m1]KAJ5037400.1 hypothetical protein L3040_007575 [Drepanopeziza brunnea f. sp. 'multigermtubi']